MHQRLKRPVAVLSSMFTSPVPEGYPHFRRNYVLGILNGLFFNTGVSFFHRTTVVPLFLASLGAPSVLISLVTHLEGVGWHLPQLVAATLIAHRARTMSVYRVASMVRFIGIATALASPLLAASQPMIALVTFVAGYAVFALAGGFSGIAYLELVAKTCPKQRRGTYFGWRAITSGIAGLILGVNVVKPIFTQFEFPISYLIVFACGALLIGASFVVLYQTREPDGTDLPAKRTVGVQMTTAWAILRTNATFRRFVVFRALVMLCFAGLPFYILFARDRLHMGVAASGLFISWEYAGLIVANLVWGWLSNRIGNRSVLTLSCVIAFVASGAALLYATGWVALPAWGFGLLFFMNAAIESGFSNAGIGYALEIVPELDRPTYIGLMNTVIAAVLLVTAAVAASVRDILGYAGLFATVAAAALLGLVMIVRLPEPRHWS